MIALLEDEDTITEKMGSLLIMWKFQNFSFAQILREINFGESRTSKTAVFAVFGALNFANLVNFNLQKVQKCIKIKVQSPKMC